MSCSVPARAAAPTPARRRGWRAPRRTPPRTSPRSGGRCSCCSASSGSCRRPRAPPSASARRRARTVVGEALRPSARSTLSWAMRPRQTTPASRGRAAMPAARNGRQVAISAGVGLFSGGAQRTALVIMQSMSVRPSSGSARSGRWRSRSFVSVRVEQLAGIVAGERPAGAVGAGDARARGRRSAAGPSVAERRRPAPLNQSGCRARVLVAVGDQARAERAVARRLGRNGAHWSSSSSA